MLSLASGKTLDCEVLPLQSHEAEGQPQTPDDEGAGATQLGLTPQMIDSNFKKGSWQSMSRKIAMNV